MKTFLIVILVLTGLCVASCEKHRYIYVTAPGAPADTIFVPSPPDTIRVPCPSPSPRPRHRHR
jgi:hypothetical protein